MQKKILSVIALATLFYNNSYAQRVEKINPKKGYILSLDLQAKECPKIWSIQIPLFKKNNPEVKNPDVISIGKEILVQNCALDIENKSEEIVELVKPEEKKIPQENVHKEEESRIPFFVIISGVGQITAKDNEDSQKQGLGYKLEIGKYFKVNNHDLKTSLGFIRTKSQYDHPLVKDLNFENGLLSLDVSYFNYNVDKFKLGPNVGIFYSPLGSQYKNPGVDENNLSGFIGINAIYELNKRFAIDFKLNNQLESRVNLMSTLGIEIKF